MYTSSSKDRSLIVRNNLRSRLYSVVKSPCFPPVLLNEKAEPIILIGSTNHNPLHLYLLRGRPTLP